MKYMTNAEAVWVLAALPIGALFAFSCAAGWPGWVSLIIGMVCTVNAFGSGVIAGRISE